MNRYIGEQLHDINKNLSSKVELNLYLRFKEFNIYVNSPALESFFLECFFCMLFLGAVSIVNFSGSLGPHRLDNKSVCITSSSLMKWHHSRIMLTR